MNNLIVKIKFFSRQFTSIYGIWRQTPRIRKIIFSQFWRQLQFLVVEVKTYKFI
jgi:hypothetical protein